MTQALTGFVKVLAVDIRSPLMTPARRYAKNVHLIAILKVYAYTACNQEEGHE